MTTLPFKMNFLFDFTNTQNLNLELFENIVCELLEITPAPNVEIYIQDTNYLAEIEALFANCNPKISFVFSENVTFQKNFNYENYSLQCPVHNLAKFHSYLNSNKDLAIKNIIIKHSRENLLSDTYEKYNNLIDKLKYFSEFKLYLQPYLTEVERKNYYDNNEKNRCFLTCAIPWFSPIIHSNGDVFACPKNKIGNLKQNSFWEIWNNEFANILRAKLINNKYCEFSNNCNYFYQDNFLIVEEGQLIYKDVIFEFASEINYTQSAPKILLVENAKINERHYLVDIYPVFSDENLADICNNKKVLMVLE